MCGSSISTDAWAVGEIYLNDSPGKPDMNVLYNAAHWDGTKWTPKRIPYNYHGQDTYSVLYCITGFAQNDIWYGASNVIHFDGTNYTPMETSMTGLGFKMWGTSSNDLYIVGGNGSISHYNGSSWSLMTSNTTCELDDIYGTDANHIWATGCNEVIGQSVVLQYNGTNWSTLYDSQKPFESYPAMMFAFLSVWTYNSSFIYLAGGDLRRFTFGDSVAIGSTINTGMSYTIKSIRGVNQNDIFAVTEGGEAAHYNGVSWHNYLDVQAFNPNGGRFSRVYPISNFVLIGGWYLTAYNSMPVVIRGYR